MTAGVERWLPHCDIRERHERVVAVVPERALAIALDTPVCPDRLVRILFRLRGLRDLDLSIAEFSSSNGFLALEHTPTVYVFGLAARLRGPDRQATDIDGWRDWSPPGVKIAADLRAEPAGPSSTRLSTETRVLALDRGSRIAFRLYWLVIGPFSALIRRRWLRAIATRARRPTSTSSTT